MALDPRLGYDVGTVTLANGSNLANFSGVILSASLSSLFNGAEISLDDGRGPFPVSGRNSNTQIALSKNWSGGAYTGGYTIRWRQAIAEFTKTQAEVQETQRALYAVGTPTWRALTIGSNSPPGSPIVGDRHIVGAAATGAWAGHNNQLAFYVETGWSFYAPEYGTVVYVVADNGARWWNGATWATVTRGSADIIQDARLGFTGVVGSTGFFADYDCHSADLSVIKRTTGNASAGAPGFINDARSINLVDDDRTNYGTGLSHYRGISNGLRVLTTGAYQSGAFVEQNKDLIGGDFHAIGRIAGTDGRGVSGIIGGAIQYGEGVATNEFAVENPTDAAALSKSMAAFQGILRNRKGAADGTHRHIAMLATLDGGYSATAAIYAESIAGVGGRDGSANVAVHLGNVKANNAAIMMPRSGAGRGVIDFDADDYLNFLAASNRFDMVIAGNVVWSGGADGLAAGTYYSTSARLAVAAGTAAVPQLHLFASVAPSAPGNGNLWFDGTNLKFRVAGVTKTISLV